MCVRPMVDGIAKLPEPDQGGVFYDGFVDGIEHDYGLRAATLVSMFWI